MKMTVGIATFFAGDKGPKEALVAAVYQSTHPYVQLLLESNRGTLGEMARYEVERVGGLV